MNEFSPVGGSTLPLPEPPLGARRSRQSRDELHLTVEARRRRPAPRPSSGCHPRRHRPRRPRATGGRSSRAVGRARSSCGCRRRARLRPGAGRAVRVFRAARHPLGKERETLRRLAPGQRPLRVAGRPRSRCAVRTAAGHWLVVPEDVPLRPTTNRSSAHRFTSICASLPPRIRKATTAGHSVTISNMLLPPPHTGRVQQAARFNFYQTPAPKGSAVSAGKLPSVTPAPANQVRTGTSHSGPAATSFLLLNTALA